MSERFVISCRVFDGQMVQSGVGLHLVDGHVAGLVPADQIPETAERSFFKGLITPGFVDLQVNGGGGVLFNTDPTPGGMKAIAAAHRRFGTVAILPTIITDAPDVLGHAVDAMLQLDPAEARAAGIAGIHIEGPHIDVNRRGTHAARFVRPMDQDTLDQVARLRGAGIATMITLAPEAATPDQIRALADMGAIVSIGHSDASADSTRAAIAAGVTCATHLFNAMSPMLNRAPGVVGAVINSDIYAGIICDGIHVADEMVGLAIRGRPIPDRMFLVSDAMPSVGGPERFDLYGAEIHVSEGRLVNSEGSLAGAHITQVAGLARLVKHVGIEMDQALKMAVTIPAHLMGIPELATLVGRPMNELIVLDQEGALIGFLPDLI